MIFHENRLLADDSHEISNLIFSKIKKGVANFVVCCSCDWHIKGSVIIVSHLLGFKIVFLTFLSVSILSGGGLT